MILRESEGGSKSETDAVALCPLTVQEVAVKVISLTFKEQTDPLSPDALGVSPETRVPAEGIPASEMACLAATPPTLASAQELLQCFKREVSIMRIIRHKNVLQVCAEARPLLARPYLASPYLACEVSIPRIIRHKNVLQVCVEARPYVASQAFPSLALPSQALPSQASPSQALPSQAFPSQALPSLLACEVSIMGIIRQKNVLQVGAKESKLGLL